MFKIKQWTKYIKDHSFLFMKEKWTLLLFVIILLFVGIIFGALIVEQLGEVQMEDLKIYLQSFFGMVGEGSVSKPVEIFQVSLWNQLKMVGLIWLLGISMVGLPIAIFLLFLKGITLGFSIGLLVNTFGLQGLFLSMGTIIPQNILILLLWMGMLVLSLSFSIDFVKYLFLKKKTHIGEKFVKYSIKFVVIGFLFIPPSLYEAFISPHIMHYMARFLTA